MKASMDVAAPMTEEDFHNLTTNLNAINFLNVLPTAPSTAKSFTDHPELVVAVTDVFEALRKSAVAAPDPSVRTSSMDHLIGLTATSSNQPGDLDKILTGAKVNTRIWSLDTK